MAWGFCYKVALCAAGAFFAPNPPLLNFENDNASIFGGIRLPVEVVVGGKTAPPPSGNDDIIADFEERLLFEPS